jgi:hypothetical protein
LQFEKEIYDLVGSSWQLRSLDSKKNQKSQKNQDTVLAFSQTMLQAETFAQKMLLLRVSFWESCLSLPVGNLNKV